MNMMLDLVPGSFGAEFLKGMESSPKALEPKWFYDKAGSALFERITTLEAYYPTRTEIAILKGAASEIAAMVGKGAVLYEPGAGASIKCRLLLDAMTDPLAYVPTDISGEHLHHCARQLRKDYPLVPIVPAACDFTRTLAVPETLVGKGPMAIFFPGSTIGNFTPEAASALLKRFAAVPGASYLIIGVDLQKDVDRLVNAYDDPDGVTAAFNRNLLRRANVELGAKFDLDHFRHLALYNDDQHRIEMHLESTIAQRVRVLDKEISFCAGETIHTECSYKYTVEGFQLLGERAGWRAQKVWLDAERLFSVHLFRR